MLTLDTDSIVAERLRSLGRHIATMNARLQRAPPNGDAFNNAKTRLQNARQALEGEVLEPAGNARDRWMILKNHTERYQALAADCLALEQSRSMRTREPIAPACKAADCLADEFSKKVGDPHSHYIVVSQADHFSPHASLIHVSYCPLDLWSLNRLAHEFGHFWAQTNAYAAAAQREFSRLLERVWSEDQAKEFFADAVATVLTGPAYAYSCLLLDFDPTDREAHRNHPTDAERAFCILQTLDLLVPESDSITAQEILRQQLLRLIDGLRVFWSEARAQGVFSVGNKSAPTLEGAVNSLVDHLREKVLEYNDLGPANEVDNHLAKGLTEPPIEARPLDILNGAWLRRLAAAPDEAEGIGERALAMLARLSETSSEKYHEQALRNST